jgi:endo-1,4-beta-xylanase
VYAWDIVNEYIHATNSDWAKVYGNTGNTPVFAKKAFQFAHQVLVEQNLTGKVELYWNDYNTYMSAEQELAIVNWINGEGKICDGIGMQSHVGTNFPSPDYYAAALEKFLKAGYNVQITEIDVTNNGDSDLSSYVYQIMKRICNLQKKYKRIKGITWWGLSDQTTWINNQKPLLFSSPGVPKQAFYQAI